MDQNGPSIDLSETRQFELHVTSYTVTIAAIIFVILRLIARKKRGAELWWDDWILIIGLVRLCGIKTGCSTVTDDETGFQLWIFRVVDAKYEPLKPVKKIFKAHTRILVIHDGMGLHMAALSEQQFVSLMKVASPELRYLCTDLTNDKGPLCI